MRDGLADRCRRAGGLGRQRVQVPAHVLRTSTHHADDAGATMSGRAWKVGGDFGCSGVACEWRERRGGAHLRADARRRPGAREAMPVCGQGAGKRSLNFSVECLEAKAPKSKP